MVGWLIGLVAKLCLTLATPCQAPLSMRFSRQEYWNELPLPPLEDLPNPRIEPTSPVSRASLGDANSKRAPRSTMVIVYVLLEAKLPAQL